MISKLQYFGSSLAKIIARRGLVCPSCGSAASTVISRKYLVTSLRRCGSCQLLYRCPTSSAEESEEYYQSEYESGFTTELPGDSDLAGLLARGFSGTEKDFTRYISILHALGCRKGDRLLDFGCSWGYGSWQFQRHGFDVVGFEVSRQRAEFARQRLDVNATSRQDEISGVFDIFFSAHVLEHVPMPADALALAFSKLKQGGLFVSITPNGSMQYRKVNPRNWKRTWGHKHPNFIDHRFYEAGLQARPHLLTAELTDFDELENWSRRPVSTIGPLDGWELLAVCKNETKKD